MPDWLAWPILIATAGTLALLVPFALHRTHLVVLARREKPEPEAWVGPLPGVTVQLPVYNEAEVVERLVDAAASLDYPRDLLEVRLLDDSTDRTVERGAARVTHWRTKGIDIHHIRREDREGFKAGALAAGLAEASGELILILDADFVPAPDLIHRLLGPFRDPGVGMVQARWDHLNERQSLLTRCQALLLDAHFFFEQGGRWARPVPELQRHGRTVEAPGARGGRRLVRGHPDRGPGRELPRADGRVAVRLSAAGGRPGRASGHGPVAGGATEALGPGRRSDRP